MGDIEFQIASAGRLPLLDAAHSLWIQRYQLDWMMRDPETPRKRVDLSEPETFAKYVRLAFLSVATERENAVDGPTFARLKAAHPAASNRELRDAICAAVKFATDYERFYFDSRGAYFENEHGAVRQALLQSAGFGEEAANYARHYLRRINR